MAEPLKTVTLPSGGAVPALGLGTWKMGEDARRQADEAAALRLGLDLGMSLIDTAEMYASGGAERVVAQAVEGRRDEVFLVSKVLPSNASKAGVRRACEASLKRLNTDRLDLYLLHWRGSVPLGETVEAFEALRGEGKILAWGVSNFDNGDMDDLAALPGGGFAAANQVLYNLEDRGIDFDLAPRLEREGVPVMAYSPVGQGSLVADRRLRPLADRLGATPAQIALAWTLRGGNVISIPKATAPAHVRENRAAADIRLSDDDLSELDRIFPPPRARQRLGMI